MTTPDWLISLVYAGDAATCRRHTGRPVQRSSVQQTGRFAENSRLRRGVSERRRDRHVLCTNQSGYIQQLLITLYPPYRPLPVHSPLLSLPKIQLGAWGALLIFPARLSIPISCMPIANIFSRLRAMQMTVWLTSQVTVL